VKATPLSNIEYKIRFERLKRENNMKPPPSCGRIFPGYVVVRKLDTPAQYETWMPDECLRRSTKQFWPQFINNRSVREMME